MLQDSPMYAYIPARDLARARRFYEEKVGGEKSASGAITAGGAKAAWFTDSEGNIMALVQNV